MFYSYTVDLLESLRFESVNGVTRRGGTVSLAGGELGDILLVPFQPLRAIRWFALTVNPLNSSVKISLRKPSEGSYYFYSEGDRTWLATQEPVFQPLDVVKRGFSDWFGGEIQFHLQFVQDTQLESISFAYECPVSIVQYLMDYGLHKFFEEHPLRMSRFVSVNNLVVPTRLDGDRMSNILMHDLNRARPAVTCAVENGAIVPSAEVGEGGAEIVFDYVPGYFHVYQFDNEVQIERSPTIVAQIINPTNPRRTPVKEWLDAGDGSAFYLCQSLTEDVLIQLMLIADREEVMDLGRQIEASIRKHGYLVSYPHGVSQVMKISQTSQFSSFSLSRTGNIGETEMSSVMIQLKLLNIPSGIFLEDAPLITEIGNINVNSL